MDRIKIDCNGNEVCVRFRERYIFERKTLSGREGDLLIRRFAVSVSKKMPQSLDMHVNKSGGTVDVEKRLF